MKQEEKDLLLCDLCARLPFGVKVFDDMSRTYTLNIGNAYFIDLIYSNGDYVEPPLKPYLRPLSSMTEEEEEMHRILYGNLEFEEYVDFLNSHHFDYRGLIEKGLALEAKEGMYK